MTQKLAPHLGVLPPAQRALWPELAKIPKSFVLYGGTGLALRLGHRASVDFDFFSSDALDHRKLLAQVGFLADAEVLQEQSDALTVSVARGAPVKVSFFGPIGFGRVGVPQETTDATLRVASPLDLAATKIKVLLQRVEAKDYLDIAGLLRAGMGLADVLRAARTLFGAAFNPLTAQKTLAFFSGDLASALTEETKELLIRESIRDLDLPPMSKSSDRLEA